MGLLSDLGGVVEREALQRLAGGGGNFASPTGGDHTALQQLLARASPTQINQALGSLGQQMDPQEYAQHLSNGSALQGVGGSGLASIATTLVSHLTNNGQYSSSSLSQAVPGTNVANPASMSAPQVSALAQFTQQNHPDVFSSVAAQVAQQQPGLLNSFVGKAGLALGAAALASHFIKMG